MKKFNLKLYKKFAGTSWWEGRPGFEWWNYDDIVSGNVSESWEAALNDPKYGSDLRTVFKDAEYNRSVWIGKVTARYPQYAEHAEDMIKLYIGYHPNYGGYLASIGPYIGEKQEGQDKFSYFTMRRSGITDDQIQNSIKEFSNKINKTHGITIDPVELASKLELKIVEPDAKGKRGFITLQTIEGLTVENPDYVNLITESPILSKNSVYQFSPDGLTWFMQSLVDQVGHRDGWHQLFMDMVQQRSKNNVSGSMNDGNFLRKTYEAMVRALKKDPGLANKYNFDGTEVKQAKIKSRAGQQIFTALGRNKVMERELVLKFEILGLMLKGFTKEQILEKINSDANRSKKRQNGIDKRMLMSELDTWLAELENSATIENPDGTTEYKDVRDLRQDVISQLYSMQEESGYDDLPTAFQYLSKYITTSRVDPVSKAKINVNDPNASHINFNPPESKYITQLTSEDLKNKKPLSNDIDLHDGIEDIQDTIETGVESLETPVDTTINQDTNNMEEQEVTNEDQLKDDVNVKKVFYNTIVRLVKIAEELDNEGKDDASEEIHKIIRKYQKRI